MNDGIVYAIRTCEALFVALWTYLLLNEKLTKSKLALSLLGLLVSQSLRLVDMLDLIYGLRYYVFFRFFKRFLAKKLFLSIVISFYFIFEKLFREKIRQNEDKGRYIDIGCSVLC